MFFCPNCGRQLPDDAKFCVGCGANLTWRTGTGHPGTVQPQQTTGGQPQSQRPQSQQPEPTPTEPRQRPQRPAQDPRAPKPQKSHLVRNVAIGVAAVVLLLLVACAVLSSGLGSDSDSSDDEDAIYSDVVYYDDEDAVEVLGSTTIVFYNDEDEALEDYDVTFMDGSGNLYRYHVDGADFRPDDFGLEPGRYRMIAREPETNRVRTVPQIVIVDEDELEDAEDSEDIYDDELIIVPDPDDTGDGDGSTTSARQAAYTLYYERVLELQELYGEAILDDAGECLSGLAFVGLVDLSGDGDGIEELVLIYDTDDEAYGDWFLEVWRYDAEANAIELVCEEPFGGTDDAQMMAIYDCGETAELAWSYWAWENPIATFAYYVVRMDGDSLAVLEATYTVNYDTDIVTCLVNGEEVEEEAYNDYFGVMVDAYTYCDSYCVTVYDAEAWATYSGDWYTTYDPTDTLAYTQETIVALQFGMMDLTEEELWGGDSDVEAVYEGYAATLSSYQAAYGSVSQESVYDDYPYLTGLCFAKLVDFDGDGVDELVLAYSTDDESSENGWTDNYTIEVWGANAAGDGAELLFQGSEWMQGNGNATGGVALTTIDGTCCLIQGWATDDTEVEAYSVVDGEFVQVKSAVCFYDYVTHTTTYLVDGAECSSEEFQNAWEACTDELTVYWLMYYGDDYSDATASLSETLAALGAS